MIRYELQKISLALGLSHLQTSLHVRIKQQHR